MDEKTSAMLGDHENRLRKLEHFPDQMWVEIVRQLEYRLRALEYPERIFTDPPGPNIYPDTSRQTLENIIRSLQMLHDRMHP